MGNTGRYTVIRKMGFEYVYTQETSKSILFKDAHQALEEHCGKLTLFRALLWEIPVFKKRLPTSSTHHQLLF